MTVENDTRLPRPSNQDAFRRYLRKRMELSDKLRRRNAGLEPSEPQLLHTDPDRLYFRFFDLPIELRDMVYHYLWEATPGILVPYERTQLSVQYDGYNWYKKHDSLPVWLFASKMIMREGLQQLHRKAAWVWSQRQWADEEDEAEETYMSSPLLVPIQSNELRVNLVAPDGGKLISLDSVHEEAIWLLSSIVKKSTSLEKIQLYIWIQDGLSPNADVDFSLLTPFEDLFDELVVCITGFPPHEESDDSDEEVFEGFDNDKIYRELRDKLRIEAACLGSLLVGNNDESFDIVDSTWCDEAYSRYSGSEADVEREMCFLKAWRFSFVKQSMQKPVSDIYESLR